MVRWPLLGLLLVLAVANLPLHSTPNLGPSSGAAAVTSEQFQLVAPAAPAMKVTLTANPQNITLGETVDLTANVTGGAPPFTYAWVTPLGCARPDTKTLNCTPNETGRFTVSVTVTDNVTSHNAPASGSAVVVVNAVSAPPGSPPYSGLYLFAGLIGIAAAAVTALVFVSFWRRRTRHRPVNPVSEHPYVPPPDDERR